jgi:hypothetical protein
MDGIQNYKSSGRWNIAFLLATTATPREVSKPVEPP